MTHNTKSRYRSRARRRGVSMWLFVGTLPVMLGVTGLVVDLTNLYTSRAKAQRAADAAALAGAEASGQTDPVSGLSNDNSGVLPAALQYARFNGYPGDGTDPEASKVTVTPDYQGATGASASSYSYKVRVAVSRNEPVFFLSAMESLLKLMGLPGLAAQYKRSVGATAIAEKKGTLPLGTGGPAGIAVPSVSQANLSIFGPYAEQNWGDQYAVHYNQDGTPNNVDHSQHYQMQITPAYIAAHPGKVYLQVFDPDCYNPGGVQYSWDEMHTPNKNIADPVNPGGSDKTTTEYSIYKDGKLISTASYGEVADTNEKWVVPPGFDIDPSVSGAGNYEVRVTATDGSSENGYLLRAGPQDGVDLAGTEDLEKEWNDKYGDKLGTDPANVAVPINTLGHVQLNFTQSGQVNFRLGTIPPQLAGKNVTVTAFDLDVGTTDDSITYSGPGLQTQTGAINRTDGSTTTNSIAVPAGYQGGDLYVNYKAGAGDTSGWELGGTGTSKVRLIF